MKLILVFLLILVYNSSYAESGIEEIVTLKNGDKIQCIKIKKSGISCNWIEYNKRLENVAKAKALLFKFEINRMLYENTSVFVDKMINDIKKININNNDKLIK